jgi:hypothetical protein
VRRWTLKNGNSPGNPHLSPRCGAIGRHFICRAPGMRMPNGDYGRCRLHGGRAAIANWRHGRYAAATRAESAAIEELLARAFATRKQTAGPAGPDGFQDPSRARASEAGSDGASDSMITQLVAELQAQRERH